MVLNLEASQMLSNFIRVLGARQKVSGKGATDAMTFEKMTAEHKEYTDQQSMALDNMGFQLSTCTHYLHLPGLVVREKILSFLTNPQDLLNLLIAIPKEEQHAPLTKEQLEFELAFPEMIRNYELDWNDDYELRTLSMRSNHHREVILRHFENFLVNDISNTERLYIPLTPPWYRPIPIKEVVRLASAMERVALQEWKKFPVTRRVDFYTRARYKPEDMEMVGNSVWHAEIVIRRQWIELEREWTNVCWTLEGLPNLRNLYVRHDFRYTDRLRRGQDFEWIAPIQLPELPCLKSLSFHETTLNNADTFQILKKLLEKYGEQLNQLGFTISWAWVVEGMEPQVPVDLPPCTNLTLLSYIDQSTFQHNDYRPTWQSSEMAVQLMSNFRNVKLKKIWLSLNDISSPRTLYQWLDYISRTFGNSLELLKLEFGPSRLVEWTMEAASPSLLEGLQFPKLVHFGTNLKSTRDVYKAILRFSVLETLEVGRNRDRLLRKTPELTKYRKRFVLEGDNLKSCGIWKKLPSLKWIQYWDTEVKITRKEVEASKGFIQFCKAKLQSYFAK